MHWSSSNIDQSKLYLWIVITLMTRTLYRLLSNWSTGIIRCNFQLARCNMHASENARMRKVYTRCYYRWKFNTCTIVTDKRIAEIASDDGDRILVAESTVVTFLAQKWHRRVFSAFVEIEIFQILMRVLRLQSVCIIKISLHNDFYLRRIEFFFPFYSFLGSCKIFSEKFSKLFPKHLTEGEFPWIQNEWLHIEFFLFCQRIFRSFLKKHNVCAMYYIRIQRLCYI